MLRLIQVNQNMGGQNVDKNDNLYFVGLVSKIISIIAAFFSLISLYMLIRTLRSVIVPVILFILFSHSVSGQISKSDSLKKILNNHIKEDTVKVNLLNQIAYSTYSSDTENTFKYAKESSELAKALGYSKGLAESLWLQGIYFSKKDTDKALCLFRDALEIAVKIDCKPDKGKYTNAIGTIYGAMGRDSAAIVYFKEAIDIAQEINNPQEAGKYIINLSQAYRRMGKVELAINGYNEALSISTAAGDKNSIATCYNSLGNIYTTRGNYSLALECFQNALKIREEMQNISAVTKSLVSIGSIYFSQKNYESALEYNLKAAEYAEDCNDKHSLAGSLLNIGLIYMQTSDDRALEYLLKALDISENLKIIPLKTGILLNIGQYHFNKSDYDKALENFTEALDLSETVRNNTSGSFAKMQIAKVYQARNQFSQALDYANSSLEVAKSLKLVEVRKDLHKILSEVYAATNNFKTAYLHSVLYKQLNDSLFNENNIRQITELEFTYKFEKEKQAIAMEQQRKDEVEAAGRKLQRTIIITLSVCVLLVSLLAIYIHRLYSLNKKANRAIRKIEHEKNKLLELELERTSQELEENQKSLTASSLKLIQKSERDAETVRKLESVLETTSPEGNKVILGIISDFKRISRSSNWNEFELLFQKVHKSFYEKLNENFPDLTANERKLCAFLKLNMSSKDIANITFQSEEALKKARQRLRQKLGIDRDTNLVVFLQNI
jgi:tetratricopeptide (TPR) repeat protein